MYKYGEERNPMGYALLFIAIPLLIINWLFLVLHIYDQIKFKWDYSMFHLIMFGLYLLFSICLECIYFSAGFQFVFNNNSMIVSGIYGFVGGFVRPLFHAVYVVIKYIVSIIILLCARDVDTGSDFWLYGIPILMELWIIGLFFARRKNRPKPWRWLELKIWRPFVEVFWNIAVRRYKVRNPNEVSNRIKWLDLDQNVQSKEESQSIEHEKADVQDNQDQDVDYQRHSRLVRAISQHADV